jgi:hypothetical protein
MPLAVLSIDLVAKLANLERDMGKAAQIAEKNAKRMESAFSGVKASLASIGAGLTVGAFGAMVRNVADVGDQLQKLSTKTGAAVEELSKLQYAASLSDLSNEDLGASLIKLNKVMGEAANGSKQATEALARFGIAPDSSMTAIDAFKQIADRVKATGDETKIASGLNDVFGKSFASLIPLLKGGSEELTKAGDELERMGGVMSGELAVASEKFNDNLTRIGASLDSLKVQSLGPVVEGLESLTSKFNEATKAAGGFWSGLMTWATTGGDQESNPAGAIVEITKKLNTLKETKQGLEAPTIANKLGFNTEDIAIVNKQIDVLTKQLAYLQNLNTASVGNIKDSWLPSIGSGGITGTPTPPRSTGGGGSPERVAELTASTRDYQAAMDALNSTLKSAEAATQGLDAAQEALHKLMTGAEWATYPEAMKWAAIETASFASGALSAAENQERLNEIIGSLPSTRIEEAWENMELLNKALNDGKITLEQYYEATNKVWGDSSGDLKKLDDTLTAAQKEQQKLAKDLGMTFSSAFEDAIVKGEEFSKVLEGIGDDILRIMVRKNITEPLANSVGALDFGKIFSGFSLPSFAVGTDYVPKDMIAQIHKGERIVPAKFNKEGSGSVIVNVNNTASGTQATQQTRQGANGETIIDVMIETMKGAIAKDIGSGGMVASAMEGQYGLNRAAGSWR